MFLKKRVRKHKLFGRDLRTLSKLFENVVESPVEYGQMLVKTKEILATPQNKFIEGLRY